MAKQSATASLLLVLDQAKNAQDTIARKVQKASEFVQQEKQQEKSLSEYLQEYQGKIREQRQCSVSEVNRYRSFCSQLEKALMQQQEKVLLAETHLLSLRQSLMQQQHRITVLDELIKKKQQHIDIADEKKLQKLIDELSSRQYTSQKNA